MVLTAFALPTILALLFVPLNTIWILLVVSFFFLILFFQSGFGFSSQISIHFYYVIEYGNCCNYILSPLMQNLYGICQCMIIGAFATSKDIRRGLDSFAC